ncbi:hypothetical protein TBLA_0E03390 [Henningerozyma blattae CBS 6284]|uniref:Prefoldin subunit 3 n=1 Tax=Henningerozyma blattae (strain ATCC 34711 / CBS 6284 / DSM 70876 / NBRC 10599 / NRRL Y-10934 / UCD 77-7) TaxID=1071380 RepID=I2H4U1_HENB6|nr:hypothetical protein TBLA_0E03390 [Tetrapisispora blattae CBS 6284]CCH61393.1 hypothetical protein TBLA_0E03390 [Tetrapisispora blattae CBS 6284]
MSSLFNSTKTNPRGIPEAPFVEKVEDYIKKPTDFELVFNQFQEHLSKYKFMLESKNSTINQLNVRIPDIQNTLKICKSLLLQKNEAEDDENQEIEMNYQLNDTLYTKANVTTDKVGLWLGADVMMEYTLDEAIELLNKRLSDANESLTLAQEDAEFLRENITTMEVNCARLYNWDVEQRSKLRQVTKELSI